MQCFNRRWLSVWSPSTMNKRTADERNAGRRSLRVDKTAVTSLPNDETFDASLSATLHPTLKMFIDHAIVPIVVERLLADASFGKLSQAA
jgi:hypothetical protein